MTQHEAQVGHCTGRLTLAAINTNLYAKSYPNLAAKAAEEVDAYAKWLKENGQTVELEITEENGQRRILTVTINGRTCVKNGAYVIAR